jgi:hypothetical protein
MDNDALIDEAAHVALGSPQRAATSAYVVAMARKLQEIEREMEHARTQQMAVNAALLETLEGIMTMLKRKEDGDE